jgi:hypothetical protein
MGPPGCHFRYVLVCLIKMFSLAQLFTSFTLLTGVWMAFPALTPNFKKEIGLSK